MPLGYLAVVSSIVTSLFQPAPERGMLFLAGSAPSQEAAILSPVRLKRKRPPRQLSPLLKLIAHQRQSNTSAVLQAASCTRTAHTDCLTRAIKY